MTLNSPVPRNVPKAKIMDEYFVKLLEHQKKKKGIALDNTFKKIQSKILTIIGPLSKVWYTVEESLAGVSKKFDGDKMLQYIDQTVLLIGQAFDCVLQQTYECIDWRENRKSEGHEHSKTRSLLSKTIPKNFLAGQFRSTW